MEALTYSHKYNNIKIETNAYPFIQISSLIFGSCEYVY